MRIRLSTLGLIAFTTIIIGSCMKDDEQNIPDFNQQLQSDIAAIDSYLAANNINAMTDPSGLRYVIFRDSPGEKPSVDSCVTANYRGLFLLNGLEFDKGTAVSFPLNGVIDGWKIGIPLMSEGDSAVLYIPSGYGYGYYGYPPEIPSNANLIFNVGIKKVGRTYRSSDRSCN